MEKGASAIKVIWLKAHATVCRADRRYLLRCQERAINLAGNDAAISYYDG